MPHHYNTRLQAKNRKQSTPIQALATQLISIQQQNDLNIIKSILDREGFTKKERIMIAIELFQYLVWNPSLLKNDRFRAGVTNKIKEFEKTGLDEHALLNRLLTMIKDNQGSAANSHYVITVAQCVGLFDCLDILCKKLKSIIETF